MADIYVDVLGENAVAKAVEEVRTMGDAAGAAAAAAASSAAGAAVSAGEAVALRGSLSAVSESIGTPDNLIEIPAGNSSSSTYTCAVPIEQSGRGVRVVVIGNAPGAAWLQICSRVGDTISVIAERQVEIAVGRNVFDLADLEYSAGQLVGFRGGLNRFFVDFSSSGGLPFYSSGGAQVAVGGSYVDATTAIQRYGVRFEFFEQVVTAESFSQVDQSADRAVTFIGSGTPGETSGLPIDAAFTPDSDVSGSTYVFDRAVVKPGLLHRVRLHVTTAGTFALRRYTKAGLAFTRVGEDVVVSAPETGYAELTSFSSLMPVAPGEYIGIKKLTGSYALQTGGVITRYWSLPPDGSSGAVGGDSISGLTFGAGLDFTPTELAARVQALEAGAGGFVLLPHDTEAFHLVWMIGESHVSGVATPFSSAVPAGRGYRYRRATQSLAHLVDPTGNTGSSIVGAGRGSFGPSIGQTMLDATHGAAGAVIVNSGLGSSLVAASGALGWAADGDGWINAMADWDGAIAAVKAAGLPVSGVTIAINIGLNDAAAHTSKAVFKAGLLDLIERARAYVDAGEDVPVALVATGPEATDAYPVDYVQEAEAELCRENAHIYMASSALKFAQARGWYMPDNVHFIQAANDAVGSAIAVTALARGAGLYPAGLEA